MEETVERYVDYLRNTKNVSDNTLTSYKRDLIKMIMHKRCTKNQFNQY